MEIGKDVISSWCPTGVIREASARDRKAALKLGGITYETKFGQFRSSVYVQVVTASAPLTVELLALRTSFTVDDYKEAAAMRDAALLFLTDDLCPEKHLSSVLKLPPESVKHTRAVLDFKDEVLAYTSSENAFLAKEGYLKRMRRKTAHTRKELKAPIRFGMMQNSEADLAGGIEKPPKVDVWAGGLHARRENVLLSAPACFGKSHIIKNVLKPVLERMYGKKGVWITASTGLAALAVDGTTIHSMGGLQRGKGLADGLISQMRTGVRDRWRFVKIIVIEEFSMLSADFVDLLDEVARSMKNVNAPFGGVMVMLVGDLAQLAPVGNFQANPNSGSAVPWVKKKADYVFKSNVWRRAGFKCYRLKHCWRYNINGRLGRFLSTLRVAPRLTDSLYEEMKALLLNKQVDVNDAVVLCSRKTDARKWSVEKLKTLPEPEVVYFGVDTHGSNRWVNTLANEDDDLRDIERDESKTFYDEEQRSRSVFSGMALPPVVRLRVGAKVLCTYKIDSDIKVGCMGTVQEFRNAEEAIQDALLTDRDMGPGMDKAEADRDWPLVQPDRLWPLVEFIVNGRKMCKPVFPAKMNIEDNMGTVICSRMQLPLILSYALTVHRAQGMTLDCVVFDLQGLFAEGQLYTALSRVRNFDKLRVIGSVKSDAACANQKVLAFEASTVWQTIDNGPDAEVEEVIEV